MAISVFAICAQYALHPGAPGVVSGYFGSGQGGPRDPRLRIVRFEDVRASLGGLIEELVCFRRLVAGLHVRAEQISEVEW